MKNILAPSLLVAACATAATAPTTAAAAKDRPNVIVILVDDMGYGDVSALNPDSKIKTDNIDRLVREGMHFTNAYVNSSLSTPSRYGLVTGRYAFRSILKSYVTSGYDDLIIEPGRMTVASMLKQAGYRTAIIGKWNLGLGWHKFPDVPRLVEGDIFVPDKIGIDFTRPVDRGPQTCGFDYSYIFPGASDMSPYCYVENGTPQVTKMEPFAGQPATPRGRWMRPGVKDVDYKPEECLDNFTDRVVAYLKSTDRSKPFFLYYASNAPHIPWCPAERFVGKSGAGLYGDFVLNFDYTLGRILDTIDQLGIAGNTIIFFASDNGAAWTQSDIATYGHRANYIFKGAKSDIWEGGLRTPLIVRWPTKIKASTTAPQLTCLTDIMTTVADIVGVRLPHNAAEDSFSFWPVLRNPASPQVRRSVVLHSGFGMFALRTPEWKFVDGIDGGGFSRNIKATPECPAGQLYNMQQDEVESRNTACDDPVRIAAMKTELDRIVAAGRSRK